VSLPEIVYIARCPEHGLHGCRETCHDCGGPVEQVPMVEVGRNPETFDWDELARWAEAYGHPEGWAKLAQQNHARAERAEAKLAELQREGDR
jgi:hypothetical protein